MSFSRRFFRQRNRTRLSPPALETLAIVAYRQPVTSPEIQAIRGKDPSAALKGLLDRRLIRIMGKKKVVGNPLIYGSTKEFLVHFGLDTLKDLPSIEEFDAFVGALARTLGRDLSLNVPSGEFPGAGDIDSAWVAALAADLLANRGSSLIVAGLVQHAA